MEVLKQYYELSDIKPKYHRVVAPFYNSSARKIQFNLKELDLHYLNQFGVYVDVQDFQKIKGGRNNSIIIINSDEVIS